MVARLKESKPRGYLGMIAAYGRLVRMELEKSHAAWEEARRRSGGNYSYEVRFYSFIGFQSVTTITATRGVISKREYRESFPPFLDIEPQHYIEEGEDIGTNPRGAPPRTVEALYTNARSVLETTLEPFERLVFRLDERGLLRTCFYYDARIADDVPRNGVMIENLMLLPRSPGSNDSDSDEARDKGNGGNPMTSTRSRIQRLKLALKSARRIANPRLKRAKRNSIRQRIRKLSADLP